MTAKKLPSLIIRISSFLIKNLKRDWGLRVKLNLNPIFENNLMFCPILIVCDLIDTSKGEKKGVGFAYRNMSLREQKKRSMDENMKYERKPRRDVCGGCLPQSKCKIAVAMKVEG